MTKLADESSHNHASFIPGPTSDSPSLTQGGRHARTVLCGGHSVTSVPTAIRYHPIGGCGGKQSAHCGLVNQTLAAGDLSFGASAILALFRFRLFHKADCVDRNRGKLLKEFLQGLALVVASISVLALGLALLRAFPLW
jgi:hypothetical protein